MKIWFIRNVFLKHANEYYFVSGRCDKRVDDVRIKMSQNLTSGMWWLCKQEEADRLATIQDFRDNEKKTIKNGPQSTILDFFFYVMISDDVIVIVSWSSRNNDVRLITSRLYLQQEHPWNI